MVAKRDVPKINYTEYVERTDTNRRGLKLLWGLPVVVAAAIAGSVWLGGCNTQGCTDNHSALPLMGFYSSATESGIALDSLDIGGIGAPGDLLLVQSGQSVKSLYLPFRYDASTTSFRFHYDYKEQGLDDPAIDDIVTFSYISEPYFASEECGAYYIYRITSVDYTTHLIERVVITDSVINNVDMERIKVFFRTIGPGTSDDDPETPDDDDDSSDDDDGDAGSGNDDENSGDDNSDNMKIMAMR